MASSKPACGPCDYNRITMHAYKWCNICDEGFCEDCEKMHKAAKISRDHQLISIEDYLKLSIISIRQICKEHDKYFDSYCKSHDKALCLSCVLSEHKSCDDIIILVDAAKHAKKSTALADLEDIILVGLHNIQSIIQHTTPAHLEQQEKDIKEEIKEIRTKINQRLDEMEQNMISELESELAEFRLKYSAVLKHMTDSEKMMKRFQEQTTEMKQLASDLQIFLGTRQINREVHECLKATEKYHVADKYNVSVDIDPVLKSLINEVKTFGNINTEVAKINIQLSQPKIGQAQIHVHPVIKRVSEVGVKLKQKFTFKKEQSDINVTGCAILPNGQLLIADFGDKGQLMQFNKVGTHVRDIPVSSKPYDITVIDSDRVAVSYGTGYIEILNIQTITVEKKIDLDNTALSLSYQGGRLYVIVQNCGIVIIDLSGNIVNTLSIDVSTVQYVTTTTDRIYYSDWKKNIVRSCDMNGEQIWVIREDSVVYPQGLTVDNNQNVFVVGSNTNNVTIISRDGETSKTLLTESDGLDFPRAIYYSKDTGNLLVCSQSENTAALYKVI